MGNSVSRFDKMLEESTLPQRLVIFPSDEKFSDVFGALLELEEAYSDQVNIFRESTSHGEVIDIIFEPEATSECKNAVTQLFNQYGITIDSAESDNLAKEIDLEMDAADSAQEIRMAIMGGLDPQLFREWLDKVLPQTEPEEKS